MRLILIHGRSQQGHDPNTLRAQWKGCIEAAFEKAGFPWRDTVEITFPFYGDELDRAVQQVNGPLLTNILLRGDEPVEARDSLRIEILAEMVRARGVADSEVLGHVPGGPVEREQAIARGFRNWGSVLAMLRALDETPLGGRVIDELTRDVWVYVTFGGIQKKIDAIVNDAMTEERCIVVAHSLGTIVAYNVLSRRARGAPEVPLFLTLGSPLGIRAISARLPKPLANPPGLGRWVNARDARDVVALHPLGADYFDVRPPIEDFSKVDNFAEDRHSVEGYLADPFVASCLYEAL